MDNELFFFEIEIKIEKIVFIEETKAYSEDHNCDIDETSDDKKKPKREMDIHPDFNILINFHA